MTSLTETKEPTRRRGRGARQRILNAAAELFYSEGINATGVGRIASTALVSKRTLYQHFPSKTALVEEYLCQLRRAAGEAEGTSSGASDSTPRARLLALFELSDAGDGRMRGCPFHNAAVEAAGSMPGVEHIVHLHKRDYVEGLTLLAREAGAVDPDMLGNQIALLYEGASALSTSLNDPAPWTRARAAADALIGRALKGPA
ncbi:MULTISPECIES: helix-turn-helix domain-containing protein [unclassified Mycobacterium]|uniref:TetR/AcrR family transcriptional regulator n=1 Tax=unclassified Mycobacterium TaxID=2642494 RepID=UPI0029C95314|nr:MULTISPECIES: helix-turn-helix domain-containing protein [unclassified Mycobacterium]